MMSVSKIKNKIAGFFGGNGIWVWEPSSSPTLTLSWLAKTASTQQCTEEKRKKEVYKQQTGPPKCVGPGGIFVLFRTKVCHFTMFACTLGKSIHEDRFPSFFLLFFSLFFFFLFKEQNVRMKPTGICGCFSAPNEVNLYNRLYYVSMCALLPLPSHSLRAISVTRENDVQSIT